MLSTGGLFAPTIRHHDGVTYIVCTNVIHNSGEKADGEYSRNFIIHTNDIWSGRWSDPVYYEFKGIDPSLYFDDDGRVYIQGCRTPEFQIYNMEVDLVTGEMATAPKLVWEGWDKRYTEGPHIYKRYGWYYLLCAEGGTFDSHMSSMARSRSIWGPYEPYERNPVWTAFGTGNYVQNTGHGDLFQDRQGQWWVVLLGVRQRQGRFIMGRETFLSPVAWEAGGWPVIQPVETSPAGRGMASRRPDGISAIACDTGVDWVYLRGTALDKIRINDTSVAIAASEDGLRSPMGSVAFVGKRQRELEGPASVSLSLNRAFAGKKLHAGLALFKDEHRFASISYDFLTGGVVWEVLNDAKKIRRSERQSLGEETLVDFLIRHTELSVEFFFRGRGDGDWLALGKIDTLDLTGFDFIGPVVGVFATGETGLEVHFTGFACS